MNARALKTIAAFVLSAAAGHVLVAEAAPRLIMKKAYERLSRNGERVNQWSHVPQVTPASRRVVRPAPDLAYSVCAFDLTKGPVRITAANWDGYLSVSFYGANTDNFAVVNNIDHVENRDINILLTSQESAPAPAGATVIRSPSRRGVVLQRRFAPTSEHFARADMARQADRCERDSTIQ